MSAQTVWLFLPIVGDIHSVFSRFLDVYCVYVLLYLRVRQFQHDRLPSEGGDLLSDGNITLLYSLAMIVDAATALAVGKIYDFAKEKLSRKAGGLLLLIVLRPFPVCSRFWR